MHTATRLLAATLILFAAAPPGVAETRTLTARDGRSMEAEILSYKGDTVRIRRVDTKQEFTLRLDQLNGDDQRELKKLFAERPELRETIKEKDVRMDFSRAKFEIERLNDTYYYDSSNEDWGYGITMSNLTNTPMEGLRIEYVLFAKLYPDGTWGDRDDNKLARRRGKLKLDSLVPHQKLALRTETMRTRKEKLEGGGRWITEKGLKSTWRDQVLHGVWIRLYDGDTLVLERASPESLIRSEKWEGADYEPNKRSS